MALWITPFRSECRLDHHSLHLCLLDLSSADEKELPLMAFGSSSSNRLPVFTVFWDCESKQLNLCLIHLSVDRWYSAPFQSHKHYWDVRSECILRLSVHWYHCSCCTVFTYSAVVCDMHSQGKHCWKRGNKFLERLKIVYGQRHGYSMMGGWWQPGNI